MDLNLREKGSLVESLWHSVNGAAGDLANVPRAVRRVIETGAWREREYRGKTYTNPSFAALITNKPLRGCGWPIDKVAALLKTEPVVETMFREATTAPVGKPGHRLNHDIVMIKARQGNARDYLLARLKRERDDLFERVAIGEMSAHA